MNLRFWKDDKNKIVAASTLFVFAALLLVLGFKREREPLQSDVASPAYVPHNTKKPMNKDMLTWPSRESVKTVTISYYKHAIDEKARSIKVLSSKEEIATFFDELYKLPPEPHGGGIMVSFAQTVQNTIISIVYEDGSADSVEIYNDSVKTVATSFYTEEEDNAKSNHFVAYVNELLK